MTNTTVTPDPFLDRKSAAEAIRAEYFPVTAGGLRTWNDVKLIMVNGRSCARRSVWFAAAQRRVDGAEYHQGRRRAAAKARAIRFGQATP